ncbi:hypothetical protein PP187_gp232 [Klebsiella phage vB_KvM-Eowyn]|uniref:Uncharacterized protein n=1 Tax=Klebsiella phage vB_KvM-Eowyn TaxID=2762819 RepID=A0A7R8R5Z1_9CAUD|nr:hypothetical protein PP187_gp232 [Klebsiella phage vB_KvM-Eowyn]CAD5236221.1 hypothetical protein LLCLJKAH_00232 [Klebsiella phage vB_KvM-Eowyn]
MVPFTTQNAALVTRTPTSRLSDVFNAKDCGIIGWGWVEFDFISK